MFENDCYENEMLENEIIEAENYSKNRKKADRRKVNVRKAIHKRNVSNNTYGVKYDNLHQYSKNKIHSHENREDRKFIPHSTKKKLESIMYGFTEFQKSAVSAA